MAIIIGSARSDERGKLIGGQAGDQKNGAEVSTQTMYTHAKGWYILRPKTVELANKLAERMQAACNNNNLGYDQGNRLGIIKYGINTKTKTECDCSSTVRACVKEASGKDPGDFTTGTEINVLSKTGLFETKIAYVNQAKTPVYNGDILVTKTKGHTVIVVSGNPRAATASAGNYDLVFNATYYTNKYPDLKAAFGTNATQLLDHFKTYGIKEGRQACATFNVVAYKANNADLRTAFGNAGYERYVQHYLEFGHKENRRCI